MPGGRPARSPPAAASRPRRAARRAYPAYRPAPRSRSRRAPCRRTAARTCRAAGAAPRRARGRTARTPAPPRAPAPGRRARTMNGQGLRKTSSPKLVVPQVSEHESGSASSTVSRWSSGSCTLPPVDSWTISEVCSRSASTVALQAARVERRRGARRRGCAGGSSTAPAASQATAVSTSSSSVVGSCGKSALATSAPVGATVMRVPATEPFERAMADIMAAARRRTDRGQRSYGATITSWPALTPATSRTSSTAVLRLTRASAIGPSLVVPGHGGQLTRPAARPCSTSAPTIGQHVAGAVEVEQHQAPRRPAEVVHPRDGLLPAVAALVQVHGGAQPVDLVGDRAVVGLEPEPRPPGRDAQRLAGPGAGQVAVADRIGQLRARHQHLAPGSPGAGCPSTGPYAAVSPTRSGHGSRQASGSPGCGLGRRAAHRARPSRRSRRRPRPGA